MSKNKLLIFMMTYNHEATIEKTLLDLSSQSYKDFEIYIIDDCSKDKTIQIIESYRGKFKNLNLTVNKTNKGVLNNLYSSLKKLKLEISNSKYFHWACPDDEYESTYFEKLISVLESNPKISLTQSCFYVRNGNESREVCGASLSQGSDVRNVYKDYFNNLYQPYNQYIHGIFKTEFAKKIFCISGSYSMFEAIVINELFIIALAKNYGVVYTYPEKLHTKVIDKSFELKNPQDSFTIIRSSLFLRFMKSFGLIKYILIEPKFIFKVEFYVAIKEAVKLYFWKSFKQKVKETLWS